MLAGDFTQWNEYAFDWNDGFALSTRAEAPVIVIVDGDPQAVTQFFTLLDYDMAPRSLLH